MYGAEVIPWNAGEYGKLVVLQNQVAKLWAKKFVETETIRGEIGWNTFQKLLDL